MKNLSGRNNRIVRNRERSNEFDFDENKKKIATIGGSIIGIVLIVLLIVFFSKNRKVNFIENSETNSGITYEYFLLTTEDKLGVIDKKGNVIINPEYDEIDIPNPSKDIFICSNDDDTKHIFNQSGDELFTDYENVQPIKSTTELAETEKNVLKYQKDNLYGLMDLDGNVLSEAIYDEITSLNDRPGRILVKQNDKFGILDQKGNVVVKIEYDGIVADGFSTGENLYEKTGFIVSKKDKNGINFGYINYKGDLILDTKYESIQRALVYDKDNVLLIAMQNGKKGVFNNKKKIIDLNFQEITYSDLSNIFIVDKNGKYGFYNLDGKVILKPEYTKYSVAGNYISVEKDGESKLFDVNGNLVNTTSYKKINETENPAYFIAEDEEGTYSIISKDVTIDEKYTQVSYAFDNYFIFSNAVGKTGVVNAITSEVEIKPEYDFIIQIDGTKSLQAIDGTNNLVDIYSEDLTKTVTMEDAIVQNLENGYSIVYSETDMKYINDKGEVVENTDVYPNASIYAIQKNGKWGFELADGNMLLDCDYDIVTEFNDYGFAGIKKAGKWGVINTEGNIIVEPTYELDTYYFPQFIGKYLLVQSEVTYCEEIN